MAKVTVAMSGCTDRVGAVDGVGDLEIRVGQDVLRLVSYWWFGEPFIEIGSEDQEAFVSGIRQTSNHKSKFNYIIKSYKCVYR